MAEGDIVDPCRAKLVQQMFAMEAKSEIVRIGGTAAIRVVSSRQGAEILMYLVPEEPVLDDTSARWPERRVVYAFTNDQHDVRSTIIRQIESGTDALWAKALREHPLTPEGHLAFGPVVVPSDWRLERDDGEIVVLPRSASSVREIEVGGGFLRLFQQRTGTRGVEDVLFRPVRREHAIAEGTMSAVVGHATERAGYLRVPIEIGPAHIVKTRFVAGPVVKCTLRLGTGSLSTVRVAYVWNDVLGYTWEMAYTMSSASWSTWMPVVAAMEM